MRLNGGSLESRRFCSALIAAIAGVVSTALAMAEMPSGESASVSPKMLNETIVSGDQDEGAMKYAFVTAANSKYFDYIRGLVLSIKHKQQSYGVDFYVFNLGLDGTHGEWLEHMGCVVHDVGWDIEFPNMSEMPLYFKAMTSRPFIPRHIPGYDIYVWIDADAWVQRWDTIDIYLNAASQVGAAFTPEIDRSYKCFYDSGQQLEWKRSCYSAAFGENVAERMAGLPMINSGVFAVAATSSLWESWQQNLESALQRTQDFFVEQTALNHSIYTGVKCALLPSTCNWHCSFGKPRMETSTGMLLSHLYPKTHIGIVHFCGSTKENNPALLETDTGETRLVDLRYPRWAES